MGLQCNEVCGFVRIHTHTSNWRQMRERGGRVDIHLRSPNYDLCFTVVVFLFELGFSIHALVLDMISEYKLAWLGGGGATPVFCIVTPRNPPLSLMSTLHPSRCQHLSPTRHLGRLAAVQSQVPCLLCSWQQRVEGLKQERCQQVWTRQCHQWQADLRLWLVKHEG